MKLTIDPEFKALIPPLAPEELAQLEANIIRDGCRDPLVVWSGLLIDGHNRHAICTKHGIEFQAIAMEFDDRDAVEIWIIENQTGRRNLAVIDKVPLLERKREIVARQAKERQGTRTDLQSDIVENLPQCDTAKTRDTLASVIRKPVSLTIC
jgi:ParB-like chromosome segregation protein Spo0J